MTEGAYDLLYESINTSRLIAFVGSGLSLVYGNITWDEFITEVINRFLKGLGAPSKGEPVATKRVRAQLTALRSNRYQDGIVVLELVRRAYRLLDEREALQSGSSFREALRSIFEGDRAFLRKKLVERLEAAGVRERSWLSDSPADVFYTEIARLYDVRTLGRLAAATSDTLALRPLAEALDGEDKRQRGRESRLPIDRRSLICVFMAAARFNDVRMAPLLFPRKDEDMPEGFDGPAPVRPLLDPLGTLARDIGIRRFFTTNYDLEIENLFMFDHVRERERLPVTRERLDRLLRHPDFESSLDGAAILRNRPDGMTVRSDVNDGRHTAPLLEFAIGNVESFIHIYHHHGRVDLPETMVATDGEYNRMYRAEGLNRSSLDRAYDVMIEGNPILFVGSSLTEIELTRTLRHKVSNPRTPGAPVFMFRAAELPSKDLLKDQLNFFAKLGVHVIHYGHPRRGAAFSLWDHYLLLDSIAIRFGLGIKSEDHGWEPLTRNAPAKEFPENPTIEFFQQNYRLIFDLDFDRHVMVWLCSEAGRAFALQVFEEAATEEKTRKKMLARGAQRLIADYLTMLGSKLNTAALRHELRQIARESKEYFNRKTAELRPRRIKSVAAERFIIRHLRLPEFRRRDIVWTSKSWLWRPLRTEFSTARRMLESRADEPQYFEHMLGRIEGGPWPLREVIIGARGAGKGAFLQVLVDKLRKSERSANCLVINCCYGQEVDSAVSLIRDFLYRDVGDGKPPTGSRREQILAYPDLAADVKQRDSGAEPRDADDSAAKREDPKRSIARPLIVLGAVDRLFGTDNQPIGAEFDWLLGTLFDPQMPIDLVATGSMRCEDYFRDLSGHFQQADLAEHTGEPLGPVPSAVTTAGLSPGPAAPFRMVRITAQHVDGAEMDDGANLSEALGVGYLNSLNRDADERERDFRAPETVKARIRMTSRHADFIIGRAIEGLQCGDSRDLAPLTQEIIKTIAFIGLPVEAEVLLSAPEVRRQLHLLRTDSIEISSLPSGRELIQDKECRDRFVAALAFALDRDLVRLIEPYDAGEPAPGAAVLDTASRVRFAIATRCRFVLHRLMSQVIRDRFGVPNSETVLSDSFNLSLYAAQPDDAPASEPNVTHSLELLVDNLMNSWRDVKLHRKLRVDIEKLRRELLDDRVYSSDALVPEFMARLRRFERLLRLLDPLAPAALRAAGGVIRGFFSSVNLLGLDIGDPSSRIGDSAALTAHKVRIRRLLDVALEAQAVRVARSKDFGAFLEGEVLTARIEAANPEDRGARQLQGYPQGLLREKIPIFDKWTPKDLGKTVHLAMENLIDVAVAKASTAGARSYRSELLEPAWAALLQPDLPRPSIRDLERDLELGPFYDEEIVWLLNERAMLSLAQGDLYTASTTFNMAIHVNKRIEGERYHPNRCRLLLNRSILWIERGKIAEARRCLTDLRAGIGSTPDAVQPEGDDGKLILALATGYLGLCDQLNGLALRAQQSYEESLKELTRLRELRAVAIFEMHLGSVLQAMPGYAKESARCHARAIEAAEGGRHTDILYRVRVSQVQNAWGRAEVGDPEALDILRAATEYGETLDMHRVTVDGLSASTQLRLKLGDLESASVDCARALALATQYGMTLRRIYLRAVTGRVYQKRGDYDNARFIYERAIEAAERIGYQRAIEMASMDLVKLPR